MKIYLYIQVKCAAAYAACTTDEDRERYVHPTNYKFPAEWIQVGEVDAAVAPLSNESKLAAAEALDTLQRDVRAESEAECTALEGVKQSLLALAYEGEAQ